MAKLTLKKTTIRNLRVRSDIRAGVEVPGDTKNPGPPGNPFTYACTSAPPGSVLCSKDDE